MDLAYQLFQSILYLWHIYRFNILLVAIFVPLVFYGRRRVSGSSVVPLSPVSSSISSLIPETHSNFRSSRGNGPKRVVGRKKAQASSVRMGKEGVTKVQPHIFYYTLAGSTKIHADKLALALAANQSSNLPPLVHDLANIDYDDFFTSPASSSARTATVYLLLIPTYNIDTDLSNFLTHLEETHHDFRIDTAPLSALAGYSVFGLGDREEWPTEQEGFCTQAIAVDKWMARLTARKRAFPLGTGDVKSGELGARLNEWMVGVEAVMRDLAVGRGLGEGVLGSGEAVESADEEDEGAVADQDGVKQRPSTKKRTAQRFSTTSDLEDIKVPVPVDFTTASAPKPMVPTTSPTYAALTKQGYTIVGSHSGVKTCRWTKSALRGRGSCYKYSFYGIASHLCMEATPSLSCSNKCVFCWRHGTNPVGTTWRWTVDPPGEIFDGIKEGHYRKIKMLRGVPGVRADRFQEAMRIRHCALSLVGEPIFYPHINALLALLHGERISTFLVCNAQHPDQLAALGPVTQLYVSVDASNAASLRRIDRPLHRDFWERFLRCMDILHAKRFTHRTVFRLTLVKGFNIDEEAEGYADLVLRARPAFVEVKGVTYCGTPAAGSAGLSMRNVPFYADVSAFALALDAALRRRGLAYGIAAEHAHSCCILLADRARFYRPSAVDGVDRWHTLIDYDAFFRCLESGTPFRPEDYVGAPTPDWALWGHGGFDPRDQRVDRKGRPKELGSAEKVVQAA